VNVNASTSVFGSRSTAQGPVNDHRPLIDSGGWWRHDGYIPIQSDRQLPAHPFLPVAMVNGEFSFLGRVVFDFGASLRFPSSRVDLKFAAHDFASDVEQSLNI
jgi:hypothetical protein